MFDLILRGGLVLDGTGAPGRPADIGIRGDLIAAVDSLGRAGAPVELDCAGLVVCPGFIDVRTRSDFTRLLGPRAERLVHQGVTTEIVGHCGFSGAPWLGAAPELQGAGFGALGLAPDWTDMAGYLDALGRAGSSVNCATLVGHNTVRAAVMGLAARPARADQRRAMARQVEAALEAGAIGFSSGLPYAPGSAATAEEIAALVGIAARHGGIYATHIRSEDVALTEGVAEALDTARRASVALQLSHHPPKFPAHGQSERTLAMIEAAGRDGLEVACDLHAYTTDAARLVDFLPAWALEGGLVSLPSRLREHRFRVRVRASIAEATGMLAPIQLIRAGRWQDLRLERSTATPELIGETFDGIARARARDAFEAFLDVMAEQGEAIGEALVIAGVSDEADVVRVLRHPASMLGSGGDALGSGPLAARRAHPQSHGTFPRVLAGYVREQGALTLPEAVRKMTSLPAARFRLRGRGRIAPGLAADVVAFDPERVTETADEGPGRLARGVHHVIVNGRVVLARGVHQGTTPGRVLRRGSVG